MEDNIFIVGLLWATGRKFEHWVRLSTGKTTVTADRQGGMIDHHLMAILNNEGIQCTVAEDSISNVALVAPPPPYDKTDGAFHRPSQF